MQLDIGEVAATRSFVFLWCGSSEGLDMGRFCLRKWGFRRCEDICWIRTNINNPGHSKNLEPKAVFQRTKVHHALMKLVLGNATENYYILVQNVCLYCSRNTALWELRAQCVGQQMGILSMQMLILTL